MDQWMDMDGGGQIQPKCCPRCKTPIKVCMRYNDKIKNAFGDIAKAKKKILSLKGNPIAFFENTSRQLSECRRLLKECGPLNNSIVKNIDWYLGIWYQEIKPTDKKMNGKKKNVYPSLGSDIRFLIEVNVDFLARLLDMLKKMLVEPPRSSFKMKSELINELCGFFKQLLRSLVERDRISTNEYRAVTRELDRLDYVRAYFVLQSAPAFPVAGSPSPENELIQRLLMKNTRVLEDGQKVEIRAAMETLGVKLRTGIGISDKERREIVQALGMGRGHWFKCPNGHIYAIGDCGGASVISRCNECHALIGGTGHRILGDNRHAGEMDNSAGPAWPQ
jgi:hypothetical protein